MRKAVAEALEQLTERQRVVLIAKVYDGLTFAEIAAEQELSLGTVKTHYLRALSCIRDRLALNWRPERGEA